MPRGVASLKKSLSYSLYQELYASESPVKSVQPLQRLHETNRQPDEHCEKCYFGICIAHTTITLILKPEAPILFIYLYIDLSS